MNSLCLVALIACAIPNVLGVDVVIANLGTYTLANAAEETCSAKTGVEFSAWSHSAKSSTACDGKGAIAWNTVKNLVVGVTGNVPALAVATMVKASTDVNDCIADIATTKLCVAVSCDESSATVDTSALIAARASHAAHVCLLLEKIRVECGNCDLNSCTTAYLNEQIVDGYKFNPAAGGAELECYKLPAAMCTAFQSAATASKAKCQALMDNVADLDGAAGSELSTMRFTWADTGTTPATVGACANTCTAATPPEVTTTTTPAPCKTTAGADTTTTTTTVKSGAFRYGVSTLSLAALFTLV